MDDGSDNGGEIIEDETAEWPKISEVIKTHSSFEDYVNVDNFLFICTSNEGEVLEDQREQGIAEEEIDEGDLVSAPSKIEVQVWPQSLMTSRIRSEMTSMVVNVFKFLVSLAEFLICCQSPICTVV